MPPRPRMALLARHLACQLWLPALIIVTLAYLGLVAHHRGLTTFINGEDCLWVRGENFGWGDRTVQTYLLHRLFREHHGESLELLYGAALLLHFLNALALYGLVTAMIRGLRTRLLAGRADAHLAGGTAGALFLLYHTTNLGYLSAISYQMCTLAMLLALAMAVIHLRGGHPLWWAGAAIAWVGALNTHSYAFGFPLLVALIELHVRRTSDMPGRLRAALWRYLLLAVVLGVHLALNMQTFDTQWVKRPDPPPFGLLSEPGWVYAFFATCVEFFAARFSSGNLPALTDPRVLPTTLPGALADVAPWALLALLVGCALLTARNLWRRRAAGLAAGVTFFLVAWNLPIYPQVRLAPFVTEPTWRYELSMAALCALLALIGMGLTRRLAALSGRAMPGLAGALLAVPLVVWALAASAEDQAYLMRVLRGTRSLNNQSSCEPARWCEQQPRLTRAEVVRRAAARASLRCADLHGLDLRGVDLRGVDLHGANLSAASLDGAKLQGARLSGACLNWSGLVQADLSGADLRHARLTGATLRGARLCGAKVEGLKDACATDIVGELLQRRCP